MISVYHLRCGMVSIYCIDRFKVLECVRRRVTQLVEGLEGMSCEERPRTFGLSHLEKRRLRGNLTAPYSFLRGGCGEGRAEIFSWDPVIGLMETVQSCA